MSFQSMRWVGKTKKRHLCSWCGQHGPNIWRAIEQVLAELKLEVPAGLVE